MITQINKGDWFICTVDFHRHSDTLFVKGKLYQSHDDHFIIDENGHEQGGWNLEILNQHFELWKT